MKQNYHVIFMIDGECVYEYNMLADTADFATQTFDSNVIFCAQSCCLEHQASELSAYVTFQNKFVKHYLIDFKEAVDNKPLIIKSDNINDKSMFYADNLDVDDDGNLIRIVPEETEENLDILNVREASKEEKIILAMITSAILGIFFTLLNYITPEGKYTQNPTIIDHLVDFINDLEVLGMGGSIASVIGSITLLCAINKNKKKRENHKSIK